MLTIYLLLYFLLAVYTLIAAALLIVLVIYQVLKLNLVAYNLSLSLYLPHFSSTFKWVHNSNFPLAVKGKAVQLDF